MKILVIGGGGREHALVWKLKQGRGVETVFCSPGNGGIGRDAVLVPACAEGDGGSTAELVRQKKIALTVVGPEAPLAGGLADALRAAGISVFGPGAKAARLEASKVFSKEFMKRVGIPTADFEPFDEAARAAAHAEKRGGAVVVKADGLCAGKGVSVCSGMEEAREAIEAMLVRRAFGAAGERILIEERLVGEEFSLMAFCDGNALVPLPAAKDYKRAFDGNRGPNTGGMGAIAPCAVPRQARERIQKEICDRFLAALQKEGLDYRGLIYFGLMLTPQGPKVLEFNVRFGDPETEAVLPLLQSDLAEALQAVSEGELRRAAVRFYEDFSMTVVLASGGYPGPFEKHRPIEGLDSVGDPQGRIQVFHAGTVEEKGRIFTSGGRVLNVQARARTPEEARTLCYGAVRKIRFEGMHYRADIGASNAAPVPSLG